MGDVLKVLKDTPIPLTFIWAGLFFLLLAFVTKLGGIIEVQTNQRRSAIFIGLLLLTLGLVLNLTPVFEVKKAEIKTSESPSEDKKLLVDKIKPSPSESTETFTKNIKPTEEVPDSPSSQEPSQSLEKSSIRSTPNYPSDQETRQSPVQFMQEYFANINANQIDKSWEMLTYDFQVNKSGGKTQFTKWWRSVDQILVQDISLVSQDSNSATVDVKTAYVFGSKVNKEKPLRYKLLWNDSKQSWQIDDRKRI